MIETVTIWVPTAKGAVRVDGCVQDRDGTIRKPGGFAWFYRNTEGKDWCRTEAQARAVAEQIRLKRIASLKKQLAQLEKLGQHSTTASRERG